MNDVCQEVAAYIRACEHLLCKEGMLTDDERSLIEYYVTELSGAFLSDKPTVRLPYNGTVAVKESSEAL